MRRPHTSGGRQPAGSTHACAIESVGCPTNQTDLVVLALGPRMWPRKLVTAKQLQESR
jgi:hypothetical protein